MKKIKLLLIFLSASHSSFEQEIKKDSISCSCNYKVELNTPNVKEEDELEGTVIAEYEIDSLCFAGNPKIIKSLGPAYDKEVLRVIKQSIALNNKCVSRCKSSFCEKGKVRFPFTFKKEDNNDD
jgi:hypothetical protein